MPPRTVKRGAGPKRSVRATRGSQKAQDQQPEPLAVPEEPVKVEEVPVVEEEVKVEEKLVEKVEEKPVVVELEPEAKPVAVASDVKSKFVFFFFFFFFVLGLLNFVLCLI